MTFRHALPLLALALIGPRTALAQEVDCAAAETQVEMTFCAEQDWQDADADLNDAYKAAMAVMQQTDAALPADQQGAEVALREAQRAWIIFRDQGCAAEGYQMHGGTVEPMVIYECRARLSQSRAEDLWALAEGPDGSGN